MWFDGLVDAYSLSPSFHARHGWNFCTKFNCTIFVGLITFWLKWTFLYESWWPNVFTIQFLLNAAHSSISVKKAAFINYTNVYNVQSVSYRTCTWLLIWWGLEVVTICNHLITTLSWFLFCLFFFIFFRLWLTRCRGEWYATTPPAEELWR